MARLLVVHHPVSPATQSLLEAALAGLREPGLETIEPVVRPALAAGPTEVLAADGFLLGTPANIGYMSGALKHFFDQIYYPTLLANPGAPYGFWVHGNDDTAGAARAVGSIARGLSWRQVSEPVLATGAVDRAVREQTAELAATVAAALLR